MFLNLKNKNKKMITDFLVNGSFRDVELYYFLLTNCDRMVLNE